MARARVAVWRASLKASKARDIKNDVALPTYFFSWRGSNGRGRMAACCCCCRCCDGLAKGHGPRYVH